jgi:hypothetical protein
VTTRELIALLSGLAVAIALSYAFAIEPKTWQYFLLVIPMVAVAFAVEWILDRREVAE